MPEGPEVETVRRSLLPKVQGRTIERVRVSRLALRTPVTTRDFKPLLHRTIVDVGRHGKLLWLDAGGAGACVRLGMTGRLTIEAATSTPRLHTHVRLSLDDGQELRFCDPRRFGEVVPFADVATLEVARSTLGPDGISLDDDGRARVIASLRRTKRTIKDALLDQRVVAGVGNIYASEACFIAGLSPWRAGIELSALEATRLVAAVEETLRLGVLRRGTSFSDYVDADGVEGTNASYLLVFQREGEACVRCPSRARAVIRRETQGARSTFFCPRCQRR